MRRGEVTIEEEIKNADKYREEVEKLRHEKGDEWLVALGVRNQRWRDQNQAKKYSSSGIAPALRAQTGPSAPQSLIDLIEGTVAMFASS
eukprot:SAG31_NODE_450_length_15512_cov_5.788555_19_plen_89_part_00